MNQQGFVTIIVSVKAFIQKSRLESVQEELIKGAGPLSQDTTTEQFLLIHIRKIRKKYFFPGKNN